MLNSEEPFSGSNGTHRPALCGMPPHDLIERTRRFSLAVLKFCRRLPRTSEANEAGCQLRRAASSVRSNYRAARKGRSRAEFEAKLGIVWEEADECVDWLEFLRDARIKDDPAMLDESRQLARIFAQSVKSARENTTRIKKRPKS